MDTIPVAERADLTDAQWAVLEPLLPKGTKPARPPNWSKRRLMALRRTVTAATRRSGEVGARGDWL